jgi:peptidoglycan/xylan/chitin deacetylase (PgdA/CDA1 family)
MQCATHRRAALVFTFDDGWKDTATVAWPIARRYEIPVTVFICPEQMDAVAPFWPERVAAMLRAASEKRSFDDIEIVVEQLKSEKPEGRDYWLATQAAISGSRGPAAVDCTMSWTDAIQMSIQGVTFGSHTSTHQILTAMPAATVRREVKTSKQAIEQELGVLCKAISYPNGSSSDEIRAIVTEEGYAMGFSTRQAVWSPECDPLAIPRCNIYEDNVVGPFGRFSKSMFEYTSIWKPWRASLRSTRTGGRIAAWPDVSVAGR